MPTYNQQDALRLRLSALKAEYGTTNRFVARQTKLSENTISQFSKGLKNLTEQQYSTINVFLANKGFSDDLECLTVIIQGR